MASNSAPTTPIRQPSYARPTAASEGHRTTHEQEDEKPTPSTPTSPLRREVFRCYSLSTVSSRSKARWLGPFRFLSLPPEIRNRIYEYSGIECAARDIDLHQPKLNSTLQCLPRLLQTNLQIRDEAGSYYFSSGAFDIMIDRYRMHAFMAWLKSIGPFNRESLANNKGVTVRLTLDAQKFYCGERTLPYSSRVSGNISFSDAAYVTGLGPKLDSLRERYKGLDKWKFKSQHIRDTNHRRWWDGRDFYEVHFSVAFFAKVRTVIKGILALLDGREVDTKDDGDRDWLQPDGWTTKGGVECYEIKVKSGRRLTVYPQT